MVADEKLKKVRWEHLAAILSRKQYDGTMNQVDALLVSPRSLNQINATHMELISLSFSHSFTYTYYYHTLYTC